MPKHIIALTGEKLSGKGTIAAYAEEQYSANVVRFSKPLSDILARLHLDNTRDHLVRLASHLRNAFGENILVSAITSDIAESQAELVIIDGLRYEVEYEQTKDLGAYTLVYVTAPVETRYERAQNRNEKQDEADMSYEEFLAREHDATEEGIHALKNAADITIENNGSLADLFKQVDTLLSKIP